MTGDDDIDGLIASLCARVNEYIVRLVEIETELEKLKRTNDFWHEAWFMQRDATGEIAVRERRFGREETAAYVAQLETELAELKGKT